MQFAPELVSGQRLETSQPQKSLIDRGIRVSYGSDGMPHGPMVGIYGAVTRKSSDGKVYGPGVTRESAAGDPQLHGRDGLYDL